MKKTVLMISIFLTVFVLGIVAAVGKVVADSRQPVAVATAEVQQMIAERDAAYNQVIDEANQRLQSANQTIDTLNSQLQSAEAAKPVYFPIQEAAKAAMESAGDGAALANVPDLVDYQGSAAYEVSMADGAVVYVDAVSGLVVYNSLTGDASAAINPDQAAAASVAYMKGGKVTKVERTVVKDVPMYKVTFSTGSTVFVDMRGQVAYVKLIQNVVASNPSSGTSNNSSSGQSSGGGGHESDDHDDGGDD
jgi:hypothetical protein